jgi:DNA-binding LacI/PurR family transcriptional regulator
MKKKKKQEKPEPVPHAQRQQSYHARMKEKGLTRLSAWVPEDDKARMEFWEAISQLEKTWASRGLPTVQT